MLYAYECENCGEFEAEQRMSDPTLSSCPECSGEVRRLISGGAGFFTKGGEGASSFGSGCKVQGCATRGSGCASCGK